MRFDIRPAREAEHGVCRRLIPAAFPLVGRPAELLVGEDGQGIAGVCATAWLPRGFPILVQVEDRARRHGLGRSLVAAAAEAAMGETAALLSWVPVSEHGEAAAFLTSCGFAVTGRLQVYELDPTRLRTSIAALAGRARRRVPPTARLLPPREAPRDALLELVGANLVTPRPYLEEGLFGGRRGGYDQALSRVVMVGDEVAGAILAHRSGDMMEVDLNVVAPAWRGGWVNLVQVDAVLRGGFEAGLTRLRFLAAPHVTNTINLAARGGGARLPDQLTMTLPLTRPF